MMGRSQSFFLKDRDILDRVPVVNEVVE